jgi:protein tyrosine/serine phosphatase
MTPRRRELVWEGCFNVRDLGGMPIAEGGLTRRRVLVRADSLSRLTPHGQRALVSYGARTVIDLRTCEERAAEPADLPTGVRSVHVPLVDGADLEALGVARAQLDAYTRILERRGAWFASVLAEIAQAPAGAVVVHCVAGKDRTGLVVALLLALAGVEPRVVADDYAASEEAILPLFERWLREVDDPVEREVLARQRFAPADTMLGTLARLEERFGGARRYARDAGVSSAHIAAVRRRLVDG